MAQFKVTVPDEKVSFFKDLLRSLNFKGELKEKIELTEKQISILEDRLENYKKRPESYQDWEEIQKDIEKRI
ncbi:MAG: addiction module protein [Bacteroidales bacterium]